MSCLFATLDLACSQGSDTPGAPVRLEPRPVASADGRFVAVADARLDNRPELLRLLDGSPELDPGAGDARLILAAYLRWGESSPRHLLGDFAFAVWDRTEHRLFCARDPLGMRQLCWRRSGPHLRVASRAGQILGDPAGPPVSAALDEQAVADYLAGLPDAPGRTFFRDIRSLPPGHVLVSSAFGDRVERYWDLADVAPVVYRRDEEYAERFRETLDDAVRARLRTGAGGGVAVAMSGGLDSCSVAALARRALAGGAGDGTRLFACSFVFDSLPECDEREPIALAAAAFGIEVATVSADRFWFLSDPEAYRPALDSPYLAWDSCFHELLRRAREGGAQVLLTGHGGDDVLCGSPRIYADRLRGGDLRALGEIAAYARRRGADRWRVLYHYLARPLLPAGLDGALRRLAGRRPADTPVPAWITEGLARRSGLGDRWAASGSAASARQEVLEHLSRLSGDRVVGWYDRCAAAHGIEARHPFLDRRLVELAAAVPIAQLFRAGEHKPLLRRAMAGLLPEPIRQRRHKTRLGRYVDLGLREKEVRRVEELLAAPLAADLGFVDPQALRSAYERYCKSIPADSDRTLWYALTLEIWLREHWQQLGPGSAGSQLPAISA